MLDCRFHSDFASGNFNFTDANHFALDVFLGAGHNNAHLVGLGHSESVTASAAEPTTLVIVAAGLLAAHALGRRRRSV